MVFGKHVTLPIFLILKSCLPDFDLAVETLLFCLIGIQIFFYGGSVLDFLLNCG